MKQKCQIILLPTTDEDAIMSMGVNKKSLYLNTDNTNPLLTNQHLYICSEEEIKLDDYIYDSWNKGEERIHKVTRNPEYFQNGLGSKLACENNRKRYFKVIASTDKSLSLANISFKFIEQYVSCNGDVKECYVEMNSRTKVYSASLDFKWKDNLKLSLSNELIISLEEKNVIKDAINKLITFRKIVESIQLNTFSAKEIEDCYKALSLIEEKKMYNREDLLNILLEHQKYLDSRDGLYPFYPEYDKDQLNEITKWLDENY